MSNTNNPAHHREAFLALLEQEPPGVDYTSWLHGLCVGWRGAKALPANPAPVAPPAGKYEPHPGDVVRYKGGGTFGAGGLCVLIAPSKESSNNAWKAYALGDGCPHGDPIPTMSYYWEYVRPATDAEKRSAGLAVPPPAPTPAPEAKRPTCDWFDAPAPCPPPVAGSEESADLDAILSDCLTVVDGQAWSAAPESDRRVRMIALGRRIATARAALSSPVRS